AVLAGAYLDKQDYDRARVESTRALLLDPECELALLTRGQAYVVEAEEKKPGVKPRWVIGEVRRIPWEGIHVYHTAFSPDGRLFLATGDSKTIRLWEVESGKLVHELKGHQGWVQHTAFTPDGKLLVSASMDKTLRLWDVATGREVRVLTGHAGGVQTV